MQHGVQIAQSDLVEAGMGVDRPKLRAGCRQEGEEVIGTCVWEEGACV
jgi:hypothetical protein